LFDSGVILTRDAELRAVFRQLTTSRVVRLWLIDGIDIISNN
jgi:hypothetical protein